MVLLPETMPLRSTPRTRSKSRDEANSSRLRIALFGIFGVQNIGNECTLQAMLHGIRQRVPDADVYGISYEPADTTTRHNLTSIAISARPSGHATGGARSRRLHSLMRPFRVFFHRVPAELSSWTNAVRLLRRTDVVFMTGTGMLTDYNTSSLGYPYDIWKWTIAARLAGCKVRFVGVGVGPIYTKLSRRFIKAALASADYRSYRDEPSRRRLQTIGFSSADDPLCPDLAFSLPAAILPTDDAEQRQHRVVGLGVINYYDRRAVGGVNRDVSYRLYLDKTCDFVRWLLSRGYRIRILQGDMRYDAKVRRDLRERLEGHGLTYQKAGIIDEDVSSVEDLLLQLAATDVVVSPRFHNLVLGLMLKKPVLGLSYDPKSDSLLQGVGLGDYCQPLGDLNLDLLKKQFFDLETHRDVIKSTIERRLEDYRQQLDVQYDKLLDGLHPDLD
jgi:polysaccharide pyruvyl transferase WcaK-like protein